MSKGPGWVERRLSEFITAEFESDPCTSFITEQLCRHVFDTQEVTKSQRVSVLRAMLKVTAGWLNKDGVCLVRGTNRRQWWFMIREDFRSARVPLPPDGGPLPPEKRQRLVKFLGMLGSDQDGERASAAYQADKLIRECGLTWEDVFAGRRR